MLQSHHRMMVNHPRAGITHDGPDFAPHLWLIAVHRAFGAGGLTLLERAFFEPLLSVIQQFPALPASPGNAMLPAAVELDHHGDGLTFPCHSGMLSAHLIILRHKQGEWIKL
jgi:hypothetical protein